MAGYNATDTFGPHFPVFDPRCLKSTFFVSNVHCSSCVAYINEILSDIPTVQDVDVTILTHEVHVRHGVEIAASKLAMAMIQAAFEVHYVTTYDALQGSVLAELDTTSLLPRDALLFPTARASYPKLPLENRKHIANCDACRKEGAGRPTSLPLPRLPKKLFSQGESATKKRYSSFPDVKQGDSDSESLVPRASQSSYEPLDPVNLSPPQDQPTDEAFSARVSIGGMSCASCVNTVTNELKQLEFVKDVTVNLLTNSGTVVYTGPKSNVDKVVEQIEDIGFEAALDEVNALSQPSRASNAFVAEVAIGGMTCGSCVGTVTAAIEELPFVTHVSVNLLSHSGKVEFEGQENANAIVDKVEDIGFDASLTSVHPLNAQKDDDEVKSRTVAIQVDGMFCHHCPDKVLGSLKGLEDVSIDEPLSIKNPVVKVTYTPRPSLTVRNLLSTAESAHEAFKASVYHPPSIEDRSRAIQLHDRRRLLCRLLFVLTVTIPTFLIGVVYMTLVSPEDPGRAYLEQPIWAGSVTRMEWALFIMTTPVMFYGTDIFHVRAAKEVYALWRPGSQVPFLRRFCRFGSMNLLISAGTMVAYVSSLAVLIADAAAGKNKSSGKHSSTYFDTVVFLTLFILTGRFMEAYSKAKTGDAVASLGKLRPMEALLVESSATTDHDKSDTIQRIDIDLLEIGDIVSIPHGASPPADGIVTSTDGAYQFDESSLTGESRPVKKSAGDAVFTGSVNVGQPVQIKVSAIGGSSMLDQIISVVREGQSRRAPLERVADLLTSHFVPIITLIAILTFLVWLSLGLSGALPADYLDVSRGGWTFWSLEFAIAVFVVACPCGLALAAPTALFVGGGLAARHGILVKGGGEAFQEASRLDAIVFDKTGTLTEGGSLKVAEHEVLSHEPEEVQVAWVLAKKLEESSNHPIARAIQEFCNDKSDLSVSSSDINEISGQGMKGTFALSAGKAEEEQTVQYEAAIGNERLLHNLTSAEKNNTYYISNLLSKYQSTGKSTAILSLRKVNTEAPEESMFVPVMVFAISDLIRPEAVQVLSELEKRRVNVYMCTGDNQTTASAVADMLGIPRSNVLANVLPAGKAEFVRQVQEGTALQNNTNEDNNSGNGNDERFIVAFVGDGINDSPALSAADVSIALATGSDVALNSASFILLNPELTTILNLVLLSRRVFNRVKMNFGWALIYNLSLIPVAAGVFYPIVSGHKEQMNGGGEMVLVDTHWRLSPVWAALAMALSSISVVCSSLELGIQWRKLGRGLMKVVGRH